MLQKLPAFLRLAAAMAGISSAALAQQPVCIPNATAASVHVEGLAERVGDITVSCTGGTAGATVSLTLFISLNTTITNRLNANGDLTGITQTGGTLANLRMTSASTITYSPLNYTVPVAPATPVVITISGIRAAVAPLAGGTKAATVTAAVVGVGATFPAAVSLNLAIASSTALASVVNSGVPCGGSPLPATLDFAGFAAVSAASAVRITEAAANAFTLPDAGSGNGIRFRINLSGYGSAARIFVPDAVGGNDATAPTQSGDFGSPAAAGTYTPGLNQLLLIRVNGANPDGSGGNLALPRPASATPLGSMTEVSLTGGAASIVYEVVDAKSNLLESVQVPLFVVAAPTSCPGTLNTQIAVNIAPVSTVSTATAGDAIPRFVPTTLSQDCQSLGDCNASYYPRLFVDQTTIALTGSSKGTPQSKPLRVANTGSGVLSFTATVAYQTGSGWLSVTPAFGTTVTTALSNLQVIADPTSLAQGTFMATITVDAGLYGMATIPVTFTVGPVGVVVQNVGNAASFQYGTVAPGSYAVLYGLNMAGTNVGVTFNNVPATIIYKSASQINLIVPPALGSQQAASVIATVDGLVSNAFRVNLQPNAPGIFTPGIVNFTDGSVNDASHPAARGDFILVFLTGLSIPLTGPVTVNIGNQMNLVPPFAGAQPTLPALDQVNIIVPTALPAGTSPVLLQVCIPADIGQACSNQVNLYIK